jgi:putative transposase
MRPLILTVIITFIIVVITASHYFFLMTIINTSLNYLTHFMVQVKPKEEIGSDNVDENSVSDIVIEQFRKLFIAYTMAFNKQNNRNGNLFHRRFKRILVDSDAYFSQLTYYIHLNPVKHQLTNDFENYKWSSYKKLINTTTTKLKKQEILDWFGSLRKICTIS